MQEIPIFNTYVHPCASAYVNNVLASGFLSEGKLVKEFESRLASDFGMQNPVALNSGTAALHLCLELAGINEGDEVILPAQTFVATGLVIVQKKAVPVFADIDYETGNISVNSIKKKITAKTRAVIMVHWAGYPCDIDEINSLAKKHNLVVIEDAAHALGATYKGNQLGSLSDYTCFSFQAIKHLTTGDGGAVCCLDNEKYRQAFVKRWFGIDRQHAGVSVLGERKYNIQSPGFKYHMNDYSAALGLANMNGFFERLSKRQLFADIYSSELSGVPGINLFRYKSDRQSAYWLFGMHVQNRESFIKSLKHKGVVASVVHQRIDRNAVFGALRDDLPNQALFDQTQIHIPLHDALTDENIGYIIKSIKQGW